MIGKTIEVGKKEENKETPLYIFSGGDDPVGEYGSGTKKLYEFYKKLGYTDTELKIYPDGRHEMFNELNKEEVYLDLVNWLDRRSSR
jgi:alpha-beta hydrolase superfamily lysophospholipase